MEKKKRTVWRIQTYKRRRSKGMTMVEIMVGFVILVGILGGLSGSIAFSHNMYLRSVDMKRAQQVVMRHIYRKDVLDTATAEYPDLEVKVIQSIHPDSGASTYAPAVLKDGTQVKLKIGCYRLSSLDLMDAGDSDDLEMNFYLFKKD